MLLLVVAFLLGSASLWVFLEGVLEVLWGLAALVASAFRRGPRL